MQKLLLFLLLQFPGMATAQECTSVGDFLNGRYVEGRSACEPALDFALKHCHASASYEEAAKEISEDHPLQGAYGLFGFLEGNQTMRILMADEIRLEVAQIEDERVSKEDQEYLYLLASNHFFAVLRENAPGSETIEEAASLFHRHNLPGDTFYPRQLYPDGSPELGDDLEQHLKCAVQCYVPGTRMSALTRSVPFRACVGMDVTE